MSVSVKRSGRLLSRIEECRRRIGMKCEVGIEAVAETLLEESQPLVPRDINALADSGRASKIGSLLETMMVVGYGGTDFPPRTEYSAKEDAIVTRIPSEYAVMVHERMDVTHDTGQANYLGEPLMTKQVEMREALKAEVKK